MKKLLLNSHAMKALVKEITLCRDISAENFENARKANRPIGMTYWEGSRHAFNHVLFIIEMLAKKTK
jgi:hypothetical protein